jgi:hypothetical protein
MGPAPAAAKVDNVPEPAPALTAEQYVILAEAQRKKRALAETRLKYNVLVEENKRLLEEREQAEKNTYEVRRLSSVPGSRCKASSGSRWPGDRTETAQRCCVAHRTTGVTHCKADSPAYNLHDICKVLRYRACARHQTTPLGRRMRTHTSRA